MEASGGYECDQAKACARPLIDGRIVNPKRMRSFAPSSAGRLAKDDPSGPQIARHNAAFLLRPSQHSHDNEMPISVQRFAFSAAWTLRPVRSICSRSISIAWRLRRSMTNCAIAACSAGTLRSGGFFFRKMRR